MKRMPELMQRTIEGAASLTGKRFGLLVASSLVATSGIVAVGLSGTSGIGPLAGLVGRSLASSDAPAETALTPTPASAPQGGGSGSAPEASAPAIPAPPAPAPEPSPLPSGPPSASEEPAPAAPETELPQAGRIKHVFLVTLASPGYEAAFGAASQMPYLATKLRPEGELFSGYTLLDEAALPNVIAAVSGQPPNAETEADCPTYEEFPPTAKADEKTGAVAGEGCVYPVETLTLADQLGSGRFTWHAYLEGMTDETGKPANCVHPASGAAETTTPGSYSARLNPFAFFHSLLDLGDCAANDVPLDELKTDLRKTATTPNYSYVAPTPCTAGFPGECPKGAASGAAAADAFLAETVPEILASPAYEKDGLLIVAFGAAPPTATPDPIATGAPAAEGDLKVGVLLLSPFITPGSTDAAPYDPYALLRSVEDLFGLSHLGLADGARVRSFAPALLAENGGD